MYQERIAFEAHVRDLLSKATLARRWIQILIPIATALVAALKGFTPSSAAKEIQYASFTLQITLLIFIVIFSIIIVLTDKSATSVVHDAQIAMEKRVTAESDASELKNVIYNLETELARLIQIEGIIDAMRSVVDIAIIRTEIDFSKMKEWMIDLLDFMVTDKLTLFQIGDEQWNFSIYIFNETSGELECIVTRRPTVKEEQAGHRPWREGEGHVGKAFQGRRALVCRDSKDPNVRGFFDAPDGKLRGYDLDRYRSLAAIPIQVDGAVPLGVLVATSEKVGRFDPEDEDTFRPLLALSRTLATLLSIYKLKSVN